LRASLVQNKQLAQLCKELGFDQYIRYEGTEVGTKILADVVESYLAALLLDKGLDYCQKFLQVCLFPKLTDVMKKLDNIEDSNTRLQKATARLCRNLHLEREQPIYRQLGSSKIPPFKVGVYFKGRRLGTGRGNSLKDARQKAAKEALKNGALERMCGQKR
jgi:ribonuclease-3